jgi:Tol biopolymer transport system component
MLTGDNQGLWGHNGPTWSPDSREICYSCRHDLWIIPADGGVARRFTSDNELDFEPVWDHSGRYIYFSSYRGGILAIWRAKPQGGKPERVTAGFGPESHPSISWDGTRLVHATGTAHQECVLLDRQSGEKAIVDASESEYMPSVGKDGSQIVYASRRGRAGRLGLWLQSMENGRLSAQPKQLTFFTDIATYPSLSPDNKWVAFYRIIKGLRDIYILPGSAGESRQFTQHPASDMYPAWSPDGSELAYISERDGGSHVWVAPVKDGRRAGPERQITFDAVRADLPDWSSDGASIAYTGTVGDSSEAWMVSAQGVSRTRQITDGAEVVQVRWEPVSGDILISASWGTDRVTLWQVSPITRERRPFAPPVSFGAKSDHVGLFDLSRDGRYLVFARSGEAKGQIWRLESQNGVF